MRWRVLSAVAVMVAALGIGGCAASDSQPSVPGGETAVPTAPPNSLAAEDLQTIVDRCATPLATDDASLGAELSAAGQSAAEAALFFATSNQCADIPAALQRTDVSSFTSPLSFVEQPCEGRTVVSFWAHYDDDLIFGNPVIDEELGSGACVRTFFFTYSDAGEGESTYASEREKGIRAAYDAMLGRSGAWVDRSVTLVSGMTVTMTKPNDDDRVSLLFLRLPDGGLSGTTFIYTGQQTLEKLLSGALPSLRTIDAGRSVSVATLEKSIAEILAGYVPDRVLTHLPKESAESAGDHPDHSSVGTLVSRAVDAGAAPSAQVEYAIGYPSAERAANITGTQLERKASLFAVYAAHDPVIGCSSAQTCLARAHFGDWLQREYLVAQADLRR
ncbi:PIG-L family deacetylase [Microbacterium sp. BG28]|uniref:PIG-L family deacetylase n=1 Tax=Microbacterium sp. BG28 TaxID=3097356 RepID=UPI002A5AFFB7|nr:PIG-L family deacetylase [Microbacterium sp. BG28]MDY0828404.1 PIG-L family deacetylase [Microbacterium sp. BG28]